MIHPDRGSATMDPTARESRSTPIAASENPRASRRAGRRDAQVAKLKPVRTKIANAAQAAAWIRACGRAAEDVMRVLLRCAGREGPRVAGWPHPGCPGSQRALAR